MERDYLSSLLNLFRKRINKIFVGLLVIIIAACDFQSPSDFVVPTWFIDIKLPLVSKRFPMGDLVDTTNSIYPTEDSAGFQILFTGSIDSASTEEMELGVRFPGGYMEQLIEQDDIAGIDGSSISIPSIAVPFPNITPVIAAIAANNIPPIFEDTSGIPFELPLADDTMRVMSAANYNQYFVGPMNIVLDSIFTLVNDNFPIGIPLSQLTASISEPEITIDTLFMADGSNYTPYFKNQGYPTNLNCFAYVVSIDVIHPAVPDGRDTIQTIEEGLNSPAEEGPGAADSIRSLGSINEPMDLEGGGLADSLVVFTYAQLDSIHPDSLARFYPIDEEGDNSMFIGFEMSFTISGFDSAAVSLDSFNIDLTTQLAAMESQLNFSSSLPEMEGISFDITRAEMKGPNFLPDPPAEPIPNIFKIIDLQSTFPWDINFYMYVPNFVSSDSVPQILINELLQDDPFSETISLAGDFLQPVGSDVTIGSIDLDLQVWIPAQQAIIPLDGTPLGGFGGKIQFGSLFFHELKTFVNMDLSADTMEIAGFPPELTGIGFPGLEFEFELFNEIDFPLTVDIQMKGIKPNGDSIVSRLDAKLGNPSYVLDNYSINENLVKTKVRWSDIGNEISFYAPASDSMAIWDTLIPPAPGEFSIIDFFGSMPLVAHADIKTRIDGTAGIKDTVSQMWGTYSIKMPFEVTMNAPPFIPPTGISKLPEFSPDNRNKIRHSLIHSELATTIENSLPLGGDFAILLSDQPFFPKDITDEALDAFVDTMVNQGQLGWDSNDSLYIVTDCESLSPADSVIYIFNVMSDSSECVNDVKYLVKINDAGMDTVVSYVDTLFRVLLPSPDSLYQETNSEGHKGQVAVPGILSYSSVLDTGRIFLLTDYGDHYIVPRFSFNQTGDEGVFFSRYDAIDIKSFITFRVASTGVLGPTENDIVLIRPNGGENFTLGIEDTIIWATYGDVSTFDVQYASGANPTEDDWQPIILNYASNDSITKYLWTWQSADNLYRVRVKDSNSDLQDISGWYFSVNAGQVVSTSGGNEVINKTSDGNEVINNSKMKKPGKLSW